MFPSAIDPENPDEFDPEKSFVRIDVPDIDVYFDVTSNKHTDKHYVVPNGEYTFSSTDHTVKIK